MGRYRPELTDEKWAKIEPLLPRLKPGRRGGHPWADSRRVFEGILWILRTGSPWNALPRESTVCGRHSSSSCPMQSCGLRTGRPLRSHLNLGWKAISTGKLVRDMAVTCDHRIRRLGLRGL